MTLLDWRRADDGRALWWRGARPTLVQVSAGLRQTSQQFASEQDALAALAADRIVWTSVQSPLFSEGTD